MGKPAEAQHAGVIEAVGTDLSCVVRLDSGEQAPGRIPHQVARGMFRVVAGDRVMVERRPGHVVVLGHERVIRGKAIPSPVVKVLALDLERTLISDALTAEPRPGLFGFLSFCLERFGRVALFTTVEEADTREVLEALARDGHIPPEFPERIEHVAWEGEYKDLRFIADAEPDEVLFVDDDRGWVRPGQRGRWVPVAPWDGGADNELARVRAVLERLAEGGPLPDP